MSPTRYHYATLLICYSSNFFTISLTLTHLFSCQNKHNSFSMQVFLPDFALNPSKTINISTKRSHYKYSYRQAEAKSFSDSYHTERNQKRIVPKKSTVSLNQSFHPFETVTEGLQLVSLPSGQSCNIGDRSLMSIDPIHSRRSKRFTAHVLSQSKKKGHAGLTMPVKGHKKIGCQSPFVISKKLYSSESSRPSSQNVIRLKMNSVLAPRVKSSQGQFRSLSRNEKQSKTQLVDYRPWSPTKMDYLQQSYEQ